ncbi:S-transferase DHAR2 [Seminavis robusta]|uniref:glutathione dehydrogenase (ascorbate) n=1 Tax=Seminavis robusta TaxID=568900 RepID=A0A9N8DD87_9STRA|nr:S-transferase DHAR2 [Seminavis robusta]|eukprot:Sro100_g051420.1 S-transferase DHAR2 (243) ;mRNA; f:113220-114413
MAAPATKEIPDWEKWGLPEGGMSLYLKAGPDGAVGDCPFTHLVRLVLEEKGLEYELIPSVQETKPKWLVDHFGGKMPALRHKKECYVESMDIALYVDVFFPEPPLKAAAADMETAEAAVAGIFPAIAKYLKHTPDGDDDDLALKAGLEEKLTSLETHLGSTGRTGPFLVGSGEKMTLVDCSLAPKLYHMQTGLEGFKNKSIDLGQQFPKVRAYMDAVFARPSFKKTIYPPEMVLWGWGNARK